MRTFKSDKEVVKVPLRSGFDKSHFNLLTSKVGTITPILVDEVIPNSKINLRINLGASMPPLAADTFMKCDVKVEAFFVPMRLLYGGYEEFLAQSEFPFVFEEGSILSSKVDIPHVRFDFANLPSSYYKSGSLMDYLGFRSAFSVHDKQNLCPFPFLAYHLIYQEYYRNSLVQNPCFVRPIGFNDTYGGDYYKPFATLPYSKYPVSANAYQIEAYNSEEEVDMSLLADGVSIFSLRQRNFGFDYFTTAFPQAQAGDAMSVVASGSFTIAALRAANSMQQFKERNNIASNEYCDILKARYGANLSNGVAQRPILLGSASYNVYNKSMYVTAANTETPNPFGDVAGAAQGNAYASGSDLIIDGFTANEHGYVFVNATLVPRVTYAAGMRRYLMHYLDGVNSIVDMANPLLQNTGNQPIYAREVSATIDSGIFGFTDRYAEFMTMEDELHGLFRASAPLEAFAASRYITGNARINTDFLQIPTDYLDNVTVSSAALSMYGYWLEAMFDYKVSMPLAEYSTPSLQDPAYEHGETIVLHRGGFKL